MASSPIKFDEQEYGTMCPFAICACGAAVSQGS